MLLQFVLLIGCGKPADSTIVQGYLRSGDSNYWLIDTTLVTIGRAQITGEPSQIGSAVRAEGHRLADGVFESSSITVGGVDPAHIGGSLPVATTAGTIEAISAATSRWQVSGRQVQLAPDLVAPPGVGIGDRVTVAGYALPDGTLLGTEVSSNGADTTGTRVPAMPTATHAPIAPPSAPIAPPSAPIAPPSAPTALPPTTMPTPLPPTAVPTPTLVPSEPSVPAPKPGEKPTKTKPKEKPGNNDSDQKNKGG